MLCSSCGRGLPDGGLMCGACGRPVVRSSGTGVPAPPMSSGRGSGAGRRRRWAPLVVGLVLLVTGAGWVVNAWGTDIDAGTLATDQFDWATGDDSDDDAGAGFDTYDSYDDVDETDDDYTEPDYVEPEYTEPDDDYVEPGYVEPEYDTGTTPAVPDDTIPPSAGDGSMVDLPSTDTWAYGVEDTLNAYFEGINTADVQLSWRQFTDERQQRSTIDDFAAAVRTSYDSGFVVLEAGYSAGRADVWLEFTSTQDPELGPNPGEGCTIWSIDYVLLEQVDGTFRIDEVSGRGDTPGHTPC